MNDFYLRQLSIDMKRKNLSDIIFSYLQKQIKNDWRIYKLSDYSDQKTYGRVLGLRDLENYLKDYLSGEAVIKNEDRV